jgi:hypothetical protein
LRRIKGRLRMRSSPCGRWGAWGKCWWRRRGFSRRGRVNATHWTSRRQTVLNEVWFKPGEELTEAKLRELERNLRATGLYAEAWASVVPTADPGRVDLLIHTRDRLSLALGAAGSTVGDVGSVQAGISENNLFGSVWTIAKTPRASFRAGSATATATCSTAGCASTLARRPRRKASNCACASTAR